MGIVLSSLSSLSSRSFASSHGSKRRLVPRGQTRSDDNRSKDVGYYSPLYKAALGGQWEDARPFFDEDSEALTARITAASQTALHIAVGTGKALDFVHKLVRRMSPQELALTDQNGETALSVAAIVGNIDAAQLLVSKNPNLPNIASKSGLPIHRAAQYGHKDMVLYLLEVTKKDLENDPFSGESGVKLLNSTILANLYDVGLDLVEQYPNLATMEEIGVGSPLEVLTEMPNVFSSGCYMNFQDYLLRPFTYLKDVRLANETHYYAFELVKVLCHEIAKLDDLKAFSMFQPPLHIAARLGINEIIEEIIDVYPSAIWSLDEENRNIFQIAVMHRRENVFNFVYQMTDHKHLVMRYMDPKGNNILHLAAKLPPPDRLNLVSGAALQMQRELQWFKEVEKFVQPAYKVWKNEEGKTPAVVFSETHRNLVTEGEKWMKETATSCTVVAALVATVVFAAAITIPGGNNQNDGVPLFIQNSHRQNQRTVFAIFGIFDALSLFSSVASILMFLSLLTSRCSETDFLRSLPIKLLIGISSLFISIASLMVAFSAALYLILGQHKSWRLSLICGFASLPITLFAFLQFPLPLDLTRATYGMGIFGKKSNRALH